MHRLIVAVIVVVLLVGTAVPAGARCIRENVIDCTTCMNCCGEDASSDMRTCKLLKWLCLGMECQLYLACVQQVAHDQQICEFQCFIDYWDC